MLSAESDRNQEIVIGFDSMEALVGPVKGWERSGVGVAGGWIGDVSLKIAALKEKVQSRVTKMEGVWRGGNSSLRCWNMPIC